MSNMNDPHVAALYYRLSHRDHVDYSKTRPLSHDEAGFRLRMERGKVEIQLTGHHATVDSARAAVEPFLRAWELSAALQFGPGEMRFIYDRPKLIDRHPTLGTVHVGGAATVSIVGMSPTITVGRAKYPDPPAGIARDGHVDLMFARYCLYRERRTTLPDAVNYCLTVLLGVAGGLDSASRRFAVSRPVLRKFGELAAKKGGDEARKFAGAQANFTPAERHWLEKLLPLLISRAAEVAFDPAASRPQITMADLPPPSTGSGGDRHGN
jgi:hypothetical protein